MSAYAAYNIGFCSYKFQNYSTSSQNVSVTQIRVPSVIHYTRNVQCNRFFFYDKNYVAWCRWNYYFNYFHCTRGSLEFCILFSRFGSFTMDVPMWTGSAIRACRRGDVARPPRRSAARYTRNPQPVTRVWHLQYPLLKHLCSLLPFLIIVSSFALHTKD